MSWYLKRVTRRERLSAQLNRGPATHVAERRERAEQREEAPPSQGEAAAERQEEQQVTTIRASCPRDGEVDMTYRDVQLAWDDASYSFMCPKCGQEVTKRADDRVAYLLRSAGVGGPVITNRDVLLFSSNIDDEIAG